MVSCQLPLEITKDITFENGRIFNFEGLMTLTLTLDRVILHTVMHHSLTSTYMPNLIEAKKNVVDGRTYVRKHGRTNGHLKPALLG